MPSVGRLLNNLMISCGMECGYVPPSMAGWYEVCSLSSSMITSKIDKHTQIFDQYQRLKYFDSCHS